MQERENPRDRFRFGGMWSIGQRPSSSRFSQMILRGKKKPSDCPDADKAVGTTCEYLACEGSGTGASRAAACWSIHSLSKGFLISHQMSHSAAGRFFGTQIFFCQALSYRICHPLVARLKVQGSGQPWRCGGGGGERQGRRIA